MFPAVFLARMFVKLPISAEGANRKTLWCFYFEATKWRRSGEILASAGISVDRPLLIQFLWPPEKDVVDRDRTIKRWNRGRERSRKEDLDRCGLYIRGTFRNLYRLLSPKEIKASNVAIKDRSSDRDAKTVPVGHENCALAATRMARILFNREKQSRIASRARFLICFEAHMYKRAQILFSKVSSCLCLYKGD